MTKEEKYKKILEFNNEINIINEIIEDYNSDNLSMFYIHYKDEQYPIGKPLSNITAAALLAEKKRLQKLVDELKEKNNE